MTNSCPHHSFDIALATELEDVNLAILIHHFQFWILINKRQGINLHEGHTWTYQTIKKITAWFPYWSTKQVERLLNKAISLNILKKGNYNKTRFDQTVWYCFVDEERFSISRFREMEISKSGNPTPEIGKPIPDTYTDNIKEKKENKEKGPAPSTPPLPLLPKKAETKKIAFGTFVVLNPGEYENLCDSFGKNRVDALIVSINDWVPNNKTYKDYAAAIRTWARKEQDFPKNNSKAIPGSFQPNKHSEHVLSTIDEKKAYCDQIRGIVDSLCDAERNISLNPSESEVIVTDKKHRICEEHPLGTVDARFKEKLLATVRKVFPEFDKLALDRKKGIANLTEALEKQFKV